MAGEDMAPTRRADDSTLTGLVLRVEGLEGRVQNLEFDVQTLMRQSGEMKGEIQSNTRLTEEIHGTVDEMYAAFVRAKNGIAVITRTGDMIVRTGERISDVIEKRKTTIVLVVMAGGAAWGWYSGKMPDWVSTLAKFLA